MPEYWIQLQRLQNGQVHPEAGAKMACNRHQLLPNGPIRMHGSHLLMCEHARGFKIWNWRSGDYLLVSAIDDLARSALTDCPVRILMKSRILMPSFLLKICY
jgi:hypothetical protein